MYRVITRFFIVRRSAKVSLSWNVTFATLRKFCWRKMLSSLSCESTAGVRLEFRKLAKAPLDRKQGFAGLRTIKQEKKRDSI